MNFRISTTATAPVAHIDNSYNACFTPSYRADIQIQKIYHTIQLICLLRDGKSSDCLYLNVLFYDASPFVICYIKKSSLESGTYKIITHCMGITHEPIEFIG